MNEIKYVCIFNLFYITCACLVDSVLHPFPPYYDFIELVIYQDGPYMPHYPEKRIIVIPQIINVCVTNLISKQTVSDIFQQSKYQII